MKADIKKKPWWKRGQFRLRTILIVMFLIAWWLAWPTRTTHRFAKLLQQGKGTAARSMLTPWFWAQNRRSSCLHSIKMIPHETGWNWQLGNGKGEFGAPILKRRSLSDYLLGKQEFAVPVRGDLPVVSEGGFAVYGNFTARLWMIDYRATQNVSQPWHTITLNGISPEEAIESLIAAKFAVPDRPMMVFISGENELSLHGSKENYNLAVSFLEKYKHESQASDL